MAIETTAGGLAFLAGRLLVGGVLAFMGLNHFRQPDQLAGYAASKGIPAPKLGVYASGLVLVLGGLSLVVGVYPTLGALLLVGFFLVATPAFHDFWAVEDPEAQQSELTDFLKNVGLTGAALVLVAVGGSAWPYALNVGF